MDTTVIVNDVPTVVHRSGAGLRLRAADVERLSGWEVTPDGACRDSRCVPLPGGIADGETVDLAALARHLGQPVVHDPGHDVWVIGEAAQDQRDRMLSLQAPDFALPDLDGRLHSLSSYRGRKVFLLAWASW